jgi:integrase
MPRKFIAAILDAMSPTAARNWFKAIKAIVQHCIDVDLLKDDPTLGIRLRPIKGDGHPTWSEEEIAQFEAHYPIGTKPRLALALLLYTAQRRSDVVRMGRQHIRNGVLTVKQQKTGTALAIPVHPHLQAVLDATPGEHLSSWSPQRASHMAAITSARRSASGATRPDCRSAARCTGCARAPVVGLPKPDASRMRSWRFPATRR